MVEAEPWDGAAGHGLSMPQHRSVHSARRDHLLVAAVTRADRANSAVEQRQNLYIFTSYKLSMPGCALLN